MSSSLQEAYTALMSRAPGAAFRRARSLYLNKYPLPQPDQNGPLRLFVCQERCEELEQPAPDGVAHHRLVTLTCRPGEKVNDMIHCYSYHIHKLNNINPHDC